MEPTPPAKRDEVTGVTSVLDTPTSIPEIEANITPMSVHPTASTTTIATQDAASFLEALRSAEIKRVRRSVPLLFAMTFVAAVFLFLFEGDAGARRIVYAGIGFGVLAGIYLYYLTLEEERYTEGRVVAANSILIVALYTPMYFVGAFSIGSGLIMVGIFLMGVDREGKGAFILYVVAAVCHLAIATAFASGFAVDVGVISSASLSSAEIWLGEGLVQVLYMVSFMVSRAVRVQLTKAIDQHDGTVREHARRGALLEEAREALDRALHASGRGPFTGQELGSYKLGTLLGRGGTGEVYNATHLETEEVAAVKLLSLPALGVPGTLERFIREAEAAAAVVSPHVVRLFEVSDRDSPLPYIAMERLDGHDLSHYLRDDTSGMPILEVVSMVSQVAKGLEVAREAGIVHRDITPRNLYRTGTEEGPTWKILDFGISKIGTTRTTLTQGSAIGTPRYMAPEQSQGKEVDHRADVYSLAAIAYRALTGQPPIVGRDIPQLLHNVAFQMPEQPSAQADLPGAVDDVLLIGLSKNPNDRFETALEFASALAASASDKIESDLKNRGARLAKDQPWGSKVRRRDRRPSA